MYWIDLAQDRDKWRANLNTINKLSREIVSFSGRPLLRGVRKIIKSQGN
jgi:hypothetical protein